MKIILAQPRHIKMAAEIFCLAFEQSITFFTPISRKVKTAIEDIFYLLHRAFEQGFFVAVENDKLCGYVIMADGIKRLWIKTITSGFLIKAILSAASGKYGLTPSALYKIVKNKLLYFRFEMTTEPSAQVLSIAVHPEHQGRGIGQKLLSKGIEYLEALGIRRIKLEVRPNNISALKIYEKFGFRTVGEAEDLQGKWLIMMRKDCLGENNMLI